MAKRRRYGALTHRGASQSRIRGERDFSIRVHLHRNLGGSREHQYCASAYIPKSGRARRKGIGFRSGRSVCGPTPTTTAKRAIRVFLAQSWTT